MNEEFNWFPEEPEVEKLKRDGIHTYLWGGCFYNTQTGFIDKIYHKRKDKVFSVSFQPSQTDIGYYVVILENDRGAHGFPGLIKNDWTKYSETTKGGGFYLEGIQRSMENLKIQRQQQSIPNEWFN